MKIPSSILTLLIGIVLTLVSLWYGQNHGLLPIAASDEAEMIDKLFNAMMTISTGLFLIVVGTMVVAVIRFRQKPGDDTDGPPVHGNVPLEILWTAIPAVIVLGISVYSFEIYNAIGGFSPMDHSAMAHGVKMSGTAIAATLTETSDNPNAELQEELLQDPATAEVRNPDIPQRKEAPALGVTTPKIGPTPDKVGTAPDFEVNVTGLQFAWLFSYPGTDVTAGELHLPVGQQVKLNISANDVLHAFWVPEFRLKQDAIPGRQTELRFTPNKAGTYPVICAELCGGYHGAMKSQVIVESPEEFNAWLKEQQATASADTLESAIATQSTSEMTTEQYLAPYAEEMSISPHALHHLHPAMAQ